MFHLMNSAMMPAADGHYTSRAINLSEFVLLALEAHTRGELTSTIGYPETADILSNLCGFEIPVNRDEAVIRDGDTLLIAKLKHRSIDPRSKGNVEPKVSDFQFRVVSYTPTEETEKTGKIFLLQCSKTGKSYIGQTTLKYLSDAWRNIVGESRLQRETGRPLINAIRKHGTDSFSIEPLHKNIPISYLDMLTIAEIKKFNTLHPNGYNFEGGGARKGYKKRAEVRPESRAKMSEKATGRKHTDETRTKIASARTGRKHSAKTRRKMSEAHVDRHKA